ncbi:TetR/AcrR family transcriptional regulator [Nocardia sp. NPDC057440]|uniref:TetR/AcrR family transcriptional regulator n=1 Tax=Nocardia sp. NPDC057440 TaxID=3346134 RepID=UPI00366C00D0
MIEAARALVEANGYHGTGLTQVLTMAEAPRGSLYHHFPGGKDELVSEALTAAGGEVDGIVREVAVSAPTPQALVLAVLERLADRMVAADYGKGCPVATVALEVAANNDDLQSVCGGIYSGWQRTLADALVVDGHDLAEANELATTALALIEGALLLARASRSRTPIEQVGRRIARLLAAD